MTLTVTAAAVFGAVFTLCLFVMQAFQRTVTMRDRLAGFAFKVPEEEPVPARPLGFLQAVGKLVPRRYLERKEASLKEAEIQLSAAEFVGVQVILFLGAAFLMTVLINIGFGVGAGVLAAFSMNFLVEAKKRARQAMIDEQLIEALSVMTGAVRAGYSLQQAIMMVVEEMDDPIRTVFGNFVSDMQRGVVMDEALENMAKQTNNADVELMTIAIRINRQTGGNISEILSLIQSTVIDRIKLKKSIKTLTAQGRLSGTIISVLPIAIGAILYMMDPSYIGLLFVTGMGRLILIGGATMMLMGIMVMRRILDLKV